jgi:hypothetical protein
MTVATAIEIGTGGRSESDQGLVQTKAAGRALNEAMASPPGASLQSYAVAERGSFRSNWQSVLASLGPPVDETGEEENGSGKGSEIAEAEPVKTLKNLSGPGAERSGSIDTGASTLAGEAAAMPSPGSRVQGTRAFASAECTQVGLRAAIPAWKAIAPGAPGQDAIRPLVATDADKPDSTRKGADHAHSARPSVIKQIWGNPSGAEFQPAATVPPAVAAPAFPAIGSGITKPSGLAGLDQFSPSQSHTDGPEMVASRTEQGGARATAGVTVESPGRDLASAGDSLSGNADSAASRPMDATSPARKSLSADTAGVRAVSQRETYAQELVPNHTSPQNSETQVIQASGLSLGAGGSSLNPDSAMEARAALATKSVSEKAGTTGAAQTSGRSMARSAPTAATEESAQRVSLPASAQTGNSVLDGTTLLRDPATAPGAGNSAIDAGRESTGVAAGTGSRETFAALDAETGAGTPTWIHAGARQAEAGFQDPELGWIGVRADGSAGGIHASVVPGSAEAADALGGHLAGLNSYLAEQHMPVEPVTLASSGSHSAESGMNHGGGQGMDQGSGQNMGQDTGQRAQTGQELDMPWSTPAAANAADMEHPRPVELPEAANYTGAGGGTHISVMA